MENDKMEVTADLDDYWKAKSVALEKLLEHLARKCSEMGKTSSAFLVNYNKVKYGPQCNKSLMGDDEVPGYWESKCKFLANQINGVEFLLKKSWPRKTEQEQQSLGAVIEQRKHPFEIYPEEIWRMIVNELQKSTVKDGWDDLYSLSKAHPSFNAVIKPSESSLRLHQVFGIIFNKLKKQDLLNCRKVCRQWTAAIDQLLQFPSSLKCCEVLQLEPPPSTSIRRLSHYRAHIPIGWEPYTTTVRNGADIKKYTNEMAEHPRNPFLCHALKFSLTEEWGNRNNDSFLKSCVTFLNQFGAHVWYLQLDMDEGCDDFEYCKLLVQSLSKLPNLKDLRIRYYMDDGYELEPENRRQMEAYLEQNPLPELPKLVSFRGTYEREILPTLQDAILKRYGGQLRHVEVMDGAWNKCGEALRRVQELDILGLSQFRAFSLKKFECLLQAPLKKLCFRFYYGGSGKKNSRVFLEILQHLQVRVCCIQTERRRAIYWKRKSDKPPKERIGWDIFGDDLPSGSMLSVPSLEMLIINGQDIKLSAHFLNRLTNLRYFYYSPTMTNSLNNENIVELRRDSNESKLNQLRLIWEAVPSLEVIAVDKQYLSKQKDATIFLVEAVDPGGYDYFYDIDDYDY